MRYVGGGYIRFGQAGIQFGRAAVFDSKGQKREYSIWQESKDMNFHCVVIHPGPMLAGPLPHMTPRLAVAGRETFMMGGAHDNPDSSETAVHKNLP